MRHHYNTNDLAGQSLARAIDKNKSQQQLVLEFFADHPGIHWATYQVHARIMLKVRITSTQRCITNLTEMGILVKTKKKIQGPFDMQVHTWKLARPPVQLKLF